MHEWGENAEGCRHIEGHPNGRGAEGKTDRVKEGLLNGAGAGGVGTRERTDGVKEGLKVAEGLE